MPRIYSALALSALLALGRPIDARIAGPEESSETKAHGRMLSAWDRYPDYEYLGNGPCRNPNVPERRTREDSQDDCFRECQRDAACVGFEWSTSLYYENCEIYYDRPKQAAGGYDLYHCYALLKGGDYTYLGNGACRDQTQPQYELVATSIMLCSEECEGDPRCVGFEFRDNDKYSGNPSTYPDNCEIFYDRPTTVWSSAAYKCYVKHECEGYFCDKHLTDIHIVMTHNSLSNNKGVGRNQPHSLAKQFRDGVRGFNFDLYPCCATTHHPSCGPGRCNVLWHEHALLYNEQSYDPTDEILELVSALNEPEYRNEVIVIQIQDEGLEEEHIRYLTRLFEGLLIQDDYQYLGGRASSNNILKHAIERNQRVYLTKNRGSSGYNYYLFRAGYTIGENDYEWKQCDRALKNKRKEMPLSCRDDPETRCKQDTEVLWLNDLSEGGIKLQPILMMNSHAPCKASYANKKCRLLQNAKRFKTSTNNFGSRYPNILHVDFYDEGEPFDAQECLRAGTVGTVGCETCGKRGYQICPDEDNEDCP